jgi:hypothetical protein
MSSRGVTSNWNCVLYSNPPVTGGKRHTHIYATSKEVPETIMKGETADISQICKFAWYDWVMFCDIVNTIAFPNDKLTLGRYLVLATDIESALTAKILKQNGQYVCHLTLRHLMPEETLCTVQISARLHLCV